MNFKMPIGFLFILIFGVDILLQKKDLINMSLGMLKGLLRPKN